MKINLIAALCLLALFNSCSNNNIPTSDLVFLHPPKKILENGIAFKYFYHTEQLKTNTKSTNIVYSSSQWINNQLIITDYNSAFETTKIKILEIKDNTLTLLKETNYYPRDTIYSVIKKRNYLNADDKNAVLNKTKSFDSGYELTQNIERQFNSDTLINNTPTKIYDYKLSMYRIDPDGKKSNTINKGHEYMMDGIGLFASTFSDSISRIDIELVEQMSMDEFIKRSSHGTHRIGYIDSLTTLDKVNASHFCHGIDRTFDYYNQIPHAGIKGGKGALKAILTKNDYNFKKESGILSFHFVINCKAEVAWFSLQQCDENYQQKTFDSRTIHQLYKLLKNHKHWTPLSIRGETRDAYAYISFKFKNGEIIEILP